jgi:FtsP/CotA-like multicopper oxidase with cupredoxin domain
LLPNQPINWNMNPTAFNVGNVTDHSLLLGPAERADVIVDFSQYAGQTIIVYNDAPAAFPALDPRYDYYTGNPSQMDTGGAPTTQAGYGPNTRTFMQIRVTGTASGTPPANYYNPTTLSMLQSVFAKSGTKRGVFEVSHPNEPIIIPQAAYNSAYEANLPGDAASQYVQIGEASKTFTPLNSSTPVTIKFETKAMHDEMGAAYDVEFGRMSSMLGVDVPGASATTQNIVLSGYASPPVDLMQNSIVPIGTFGDGTQIWKIMHNGVDTHPIHFHLFNVQLINRVGWDGALLPPEPNEIGWKETVRVNPLEDTIIAMRPVATTQPFEIPNSIRMIDPTKPAGYQLMGGPGGMVTPGLDAVTVFNHPVNYGWEYVWHCHILSHEEMDMMHSLAFGMNPDAPSLLTANGVAGTVHLTWLDNSINETNFTIQRISNGVTTTIVVPSVSGPSRGTTVTYDDTVTAGNPYSYRVLASNIIGDTATYPGSLGYPTKSVDSMASNLAANMISVLSILRASPNPTNAASVDFTVTFAQPVTGLVAGDFSLSASTVSGAAITNISPASGPADVYTVTVDTGINTGTLQLDMTNVLLGGPFTFGETYAVEKIPPLVSSIVRASADPSNMTGVNYTVTFTEPVTGVDKTDFNFTTTGVFSVAPAVTAITGTGTTYTITVGKYFTNSGTLRLDLVDNNSIVDAAGASLGGTLAGDGNFTTGDAYSIDNVAPTVVSSVRVDANPSRFASVSYTVTFSEAVTGVDKTDFLLTTTPGISGASVTGVSGTGTTRTVVVNTGSGDGTLRLNVLDNNTVVDALSNPLGGPGVGNGDYISGETYIIDKTPPKVASSLNASPNPTYLSNVNFSVTFTKPITGITAADFALATSGVTGASIVSINGSGSTYSVAVDTGTGNGTIHLNVLNNNSIVDAAGNVLKSGYTSGVTYDITKEFTLSVISANGTVARNPDQPTYHEGDVVQLTATPIADWSFANWTGGLTSAINPDSVTIHGDTSVTANYTQNEYTLTVNSAHGTIAKNPDQATYHEGDVVQLTATPTVGWSFANWTGDLTSSVNPASITIHGNTAATVNYTQNEYSLTVTSAHGTVVKNPNQATYHEGDVVQLTATPTVGWSFANWTGDLTSSVNPASITIHGNTAATANYTQNEYSLTVTSAHGTVAKNPDQATYHEGDVVQLTATPTVGWTFANWTGDLTSSVNPASITIHGNASVTANYTQYEYSLTITSAHGTVAQNPNQATYHEGDVVQLTSTPAAGWSFANWSGGLTGTANPGSVTIHGNTSITANYAVDNQAPTEIAISNSIVAENQASGTTVGTFTSTDPNVGDTFTYTLISGAGSVDNAAFTISGNTLKTAYPFNSAVKNSYSFRVRTTDSGGLYFEKAFTITVTNLPAIFVDVPDTFWAVTWIERLYNDGVTNGCSTSPLKYCPAAVVTRADMAIFLLRGEHGATYNPPAATGTKFGDVPAGKWAAAWIEQLAAEGITNGCGGGNYCPDMVVTRAQMAVFLLRAKHGSSYVPPSANGDFKDVSTSYWAAAWIEQLAAESITTGCGNGNYCPDVAVTRAEMAVFLVRTFNLP